jgi:hypothetical protein
MRNQRGSATHSGISTGAVIYRSDKHQIVADNFATDQNANVGIMSKYHRRLNHDSLMADVALR